MRHFYTVEWFDNEKHAWACRSHSSGSTEFLVFTGDVEPFAGDRISILYTKPIISEGVFLEIEN